MIDKKKKKIIDLIHHAESDVFGQADLLTFD